MLIIKFVLIYTLFFSFCTGNQAEQKNPSRSDRPQRLDDNEMNSANNLLDQPKIVFELERSVTDCSFAPCPVYKVTIFSDKEIIFEGLKDVKKLGIHKSKISSSDLERLKEEFNAANFMQLSDKYVPGENCSHPVLSDSDYARVYYDNETESKTVLHYTGCYGQGVFDTLLSLERSLDKITNTKRWIE